MEKGGWFTIMRLNYLEENTPEVKKNELTSSEKGWSREGLDTHVCVDD